MMRGLGENIAARTLQRYNFIKFIGGERQLDGVQAPVLTCKQCLTMLKVKRRNHLLAELRILTFNYLCQQNYLSVKVLQTSIPISGGDKKEALFP